MACPAAPAHPDFALHQHQTAAVGRHVASASGFLEVAVEKQALIFKLSSSMVDLHC